jgi:hypothetical protein
MANNFGAATETAVQNVIIFIDTSGRTVSFLSIPNVKDFACCCCCRAIVEQDSDQTGIDIGGGCSEGTTCCIVLNDVDGICIGFDTTDIAPTSDTMTATTIVMSVEVLMTTAILTVCAGDDLAIFVQGDDVINKFLRY